MINIILQRLPGQTIKRVIEYMEGILIQTEKGENTRIVVTENGSILATNDIEEHLPPIQPATANYSDKEIHIQVNSPGGFFGHEQKQGIRDLFDEDQIEILIDALEKKKTRHKAASNRIANSGYGRAETDDKAMQQEDHATATDEVLQILVENSI